MRAGGLIALGRATRHGGRHDVLERAAGRFGRRGSRRGGGGLAWSPTALGSAVKAFLYYGSTTITGAQWDDMSPGGTFDLAQGTANLQPAVSSIAGRTALDFDPTTNADRMTSAVNASIALTSGAWEAYFVCIADALDANPASEGTPYTRGGLFYTQTGAGVGLTMTTSGANLRALDTTYKSSGYAAVSTGVACLVHARHESGTLYCQVGAGAVASAASGFTGSLATSMNVGANYDASDTFDGKIGLVMFTSILTAAERLSLRAWITSTWGVAA